MPFSHSDADAYIEDYLAHYGVKGMRWGYRRTDAELGAARTKLPRPTAEQAAAFKKGAGRVAINVAKVGVVPAALALGAGAPIAVALGATTRVLSDPAVKEAIDYAKDYSKLALNEMGVIRMSNLDKFKTSVDVRSYQAAAAVRNKLKERAIEKANPGTDAEVTGTLFQTVKQTRSRNTSVKLLDP